MTTSRMGRAGSSCRRISASTPASRMRPSWSARMTTSRSGRRRRGGTTSQRPRAPWRSALRTSGSRWPHEPVLLAEVLAALRPAPGARFVDGTVGGGGHAAAILERTAPDGRLLGVDVDPRALDVARERLAPFGDPAVLVRANFAGLDDVARANGFLRSSG